MKCSQDERLKLAQTFRKRIKLIELRGELTQVRDRVDLVRYVRCDGDGDGDADDFHVDGDGGAMLLRVRCVLKPVGCRCVLKPVVCRCVLKLQEVVAAAASPQGRGVARPCREHERDDEEEEEMRHGCRCARGRWGRRRPD